MPSRVPDLGSVELLTPVLEAKVSLDVDGKIPVPSNTLRIDPSDPSTNYVERSGFLWDVENNTFVFSGKMNDGQFEGQHAHISKEGKESDTGTMRLAR